MIRVFIVAASPLARSGLQQLLASPEIEIVGSAVDLDSAAGLLSEPEAEPDVIVVDASRESGANIAGLSAASSDIGADIPIVVLESADNGSATDLLRQGVRAILPAGISPAELIAALRAVASGLIVLHQSTLGAFPHAAVNTSRATEEFTEALTKREREVLQMLAAGLGNKEIAAKLNISDHTAKFHVGSILANSAPPAAPRPSRWASGAASSCSRIHANVNFHLPRDSDKFDLSMRTIDQTTQEILDLATKHFNVPPGSLAADDDFFKKLGIDSLQTLELLSRIENHFNIELPDYEVQGVSDFRTLASRIQSRL